MKKWTRFTAEVVTSPVRFVIGAGGGGLPSLVFSHCSIPMKAMLLQQKYLPLYGTMLVRLPGGSGGSAAFEGIVAVVVS